MDKQHIIEENLKLVVWCESLKELTDEVWFSCFSEGSWGIADVISHFISWDQFLLNYRLPAIIHGEEFLEVQVDVETINAKASQYARSGISKFDLIEKCMAKRNELVSQVESIPAEKFAEQFIFGRTRLTLKEYFSDFIDHDKHHMDQIHDFLMRQ
ncbi:DinB family protein [Neobacillus cucumis]|uniref:DinB-like domain-containing protein n=1 Tax=Neobacillus cucumis TaxID=1740721 RepID=A0A2N5HC86_9BACI|nr:DinB family protein [Neobacillus cucumis]PLS03120.1 hypothetical protein CVD27_15770 [Neobacillus cucumis]